MVKKGDQFQPAPPKKAMCAFFLYRKDIYPTLKHLFAGQRVSQASRHIADLWRDLDPVTKTYYENLAVQEKKRVNKQK